MRLLPLTLSAHPSAWLAETGTREWPLAHPGLRQRASLSAEGSVGGDAATCRFCGVRTTGRHEVFHLDGDHDDDRPDNLVYACALCHLAQHLDDAEAAAAATLVWMPEMSQAALIDIVRGIHILLARQGAVVGRRGTPLVVQGAHRTLAALQKRSDLAQQVLGTNRPATLAAALLALEPASCRRRASLLDGVRLLPTGRFLRGSRDIYPELLRQWHAPAAISATRTAA